MDTVNSPLGPPGVGTPTEAYLGGRYDDRGHLAMGGMSEVRRAHDRRLDIGVVVKLLRHDRIDDPIAQRAFDEERRVTASLLHPGVCTVYEWGDTPAGRPWFALNEVRGDTFLEIVERERRPLSSTALQRLVQKLLQVAETLAYAHERSLVHRDVKPSNVMVGAFGEVILLDWGLARPVGFADGLVAGTPTYMAPEQARAEPATPASDVFSLGVLLHLLLTGCPIDAGPPRAVWTRRRQGRHNAFPYGTDGLPEGLVALCEASLAPAEDRLDNGVEVCRRLRGWLEGAERLERANAALTAASVLAPTIADLRSKEGTLRDQAAAALAGVLPTAQWEEKREGWLLEDQADDLAAKAALLEDRWQYSVAAALREVPQHEEAHGMLADHHARALLAAERRRDHRAATRALAHLERHDHGAHAALLEGAGRLTLRTDVPCEVRVVRLRLVERRLTPSEIQVLQSPLDALRLPVGSYLLELRAPGRVDVTHAVRVWRGAQEESDIVLPRVRPAPHAVFIPPGPFLCGGDPEAVDALPDQVVWVDSFWIARFPVTAGAYLAWLQELHGRGEPIEHLLPLNDSNEPTLIVRNAHGFELGRDHNGRRWEAEWPIAGVTHASASAYAAAQGARLPNELEWEKAARGADGRRFPWGDFAEPSWACVAGHAPGPPCAEPIEAHPIDCSPYGVRGLAGNVRDWCGNTWHSEGPLRPDGRLQREDDRPDSGYRAARGGAWSSVQGLGRSAIRFANRPTAHFGSLGFRLAWTVQTLPEAIAPTRTR